MSVPILMKMVLNRCRLMRRLRSTQMAAFITGERLQKLALPVCIRPDYGVPDCNELAYLECVRMVPPPRDH